TMSRTFRQRAGQTVLSQSTSDSGHWVPGPGYCRCPGSRVQAREVAGEPSVRHPPPAPLVRAVLLSDCERRPPSLPTALRSDDDRSRCLSLEVCSEPPRRSLPPIAFVAEFLISDRECRLHVGERRSGEITVALEDNEARPLEAPPDLQEPNPATQASARVFEGERRGTRGDHVSSREIDGIYGAVGVL